MKFHDRFASIPQTGIPVLRVKPVWRPKRVRDLVCACTLLLGFVISTYTATADTINLGYLSLVTVVPANPPFPGTVGFQVFNNVGDPLAGGYSLPPDFPVYDNLILQNLTLTFVIGGNSQSFVLGGLGPGSYDPPPAQQLSDFTLFDSATLTGTLSSSIFTLYDGSIWQASSMDFSAILLPSSGATLLPDIDLVVFGVEAQPNSSAVPEPSTFLLMAGVAAVFSISRFRYSVSLRAGHATAVVLLIFLIPGAFAQESITREQAADMLVELRMIRQLLERTQPGVTLPPNPEKPQKVTLSLASRPFLGKADAPLTIVEFTDYQCPFCRQFHLTAFAEIKKNYIDTGRARFFSEDLPLSMHANALNAAQAARCAGEQNQFWALRERMSANADQLDSEHIFQWANDLGIEGPRFRSCLTEERYKQAVQSDIAEAGRIGADGTPAFVIGKSAQDTVAGYLLVGAFPYGKFDQQLRATESAKGR